MNKNASFGHGGHGADWHPSRAFHMLRGEAVAWLYLLALLDAVFMIEQDALVAKTSPEKMLASALTTVLYLLFCDAFVIAAFYVIVSLYIFIIICIFSYRDVM